MSIMSAYLFREAINDKVAASTVYAARAAAPRQLPKRDISGALEAAGARRAATAGDMNALRRARAEDFRSAQKAKQEAGQAAQNKRTVRKATEDQMVANTMKLGALYNFPEFMSKVSSDLVRDKLALTLGELAIAVPAATAATYGVYKGVKALRNRKKAKPEAQPTATAPNTGTSPNAIKQAYWQGVADVLDSLGF